MYHHALLDLKPTNVNSLKLIDFINGFSFGAGLFETIRINEGIPEFLDIHLNRLKVGLQSFTQIESPNYELLEESNIRSAVEIFLNENDLFFPLKSGIMKMIVADGRVLNLFRRLPNDLEVKQNQGVAIDGINSNFYRQYDKSLNHKLTSYVRQYECMQGSIVFVNEKSQICETPNANIFFKFSDRWATPKTHAPCLPGTIRKVLIDLKDIEDLPIYIEDIHLDQIEQMEACFLTNSVSYAIPVVSLLGKNLSDSITWSKKIRGLLQK
ncbi:MAG: aminotransferase class IV [Pseudobacteriovorax sp.]|nr:aminotransferase class IV [Pseudobacteriovorax sp.]